MGGGGGGGESKKKKGEPNVPHQTARPYIILQIQNVTRDLFPGTLQTHDERHRGVEQITLVGRHNWCVDMMPVKWEHETHQNFRSHHQQMKVLRHKEDFRFKHQAPAKKRVKQGNFLKSRVNIVLKDPDWRFLIP